MAVTRFGVDGYGVRRAGAFSGKVIILDLRVNPKWLRPAGFRSFGVEALPRLYAVAVVAEQVIVAAVSAPPRNFDVEAPVRSFDVQGKP